MTENEISYIIRGAVFKVYKALGPGLLESVYEHVLAYELQRQGLQVLRQKCLPVYYDDVKLDVGFRADLVVEGKVIVELKSVEQLTPLHHKQLLTYLRITELKLGMLVNFNTDDIEKSIFRKVNHL